MITSYAQNFEDVMLWRALKGVQHGFYIDVGAQDPHVDSVSKLFYEQGWRGVHVEPSVHYADALRQARPDEAVIQAAVAASHEVLHFYEFPGTGISTAVDSIAARHREAGYRDRPVDVPCIKLSSIFERYADREIHWLKIDVEGFEREVLDSWGQSATRPWIVVVESTLPLTQIDRRDLWESVLVERGYCAVYFDGLNRYYVSSAHPELNEAFQAPPNVFDDFALAGDANAPFHRGILERDKRELAEVIEKHERAEATSQASIRELTARVDELDRMGETRDAAARSELAALESLMREREQLWDARVKSQAARYVLTRSKLRESTRHLDRLEGEIGQRMSRLAESVDANLRVQENARADLGDLFDEARQVRHQVLEGVGRIESLLSVREGERAEFDRKLESSLKTSNDTLLQIAADNERIAQLVKSAHDQAARQERFALDQVLRMGERLDVRIAALSREYVELQKQFGVRERMWSNRLDQAGIDRARQMQASLRSARLERAELSARHERQLDALRETGEQQVAELERRAARGETLGRRRIARLQARHAAELDIYRRAALSFARRNAEFFWEGHRFGRSGRAAGVPARQAASAWSLPEIDALLPMPSGGLVSVEASSEKGVGGMKMAKIIFQPEFVVRADQKYRLDDFLSLHDRDFVRAAYVGLLKRAPDEWGERHYLSRVRAGVSKVRILSDIARSEEARQYAVEVAGLRSAATVEKIFAIPVLGGLIQGVCFLGQINRHLRDLRALENHMVRMGEEMQHRYRLRVDQSDESRHTGKSE